MEVAMLNMIFIQIRKFCINIYNQGIIQIASMKVQKIFQRYNLTKLILLLKVFFVGYEIVSSNNLH